MVASRTYPSLERKPGGPDNWVEKAGGLPDYIERIAKSLHYEKGFTISHAIATAVNTVKRWARAGKVAKYGDPNHKRVSPKTIALSIKAVAEWEAKKASGGLSLCAILAADTIDLMEATMDLSALAERANSIADPVARGEARQRVLDLAMTKDGRKSFKNQGKWGHGFVPLDEKAKKAKAKGSPVAMRRMNRLFGSNSATQKFKGGLKKRGGGSEAVKSVAQALRPRVVDTQKTQRTDPVHKANTPRLVKRSQQPWEKIPDTDKTIRNGQRYVLTTFKGEQTLTKYEGPTNNEVKTTTVGDRLYRTITDQELRKFTPGQLRKLLEVPGQPDSVKKKINKMIATMQAEARNKA